MSLQFVLYSVFELFTQLKRFLKVVFFWKQALKKTQKQSELYWYDTTFLRESNPGPPANRCTMEPPTVSYRVSL